MEERNNNTVLIVLVTVLTMLFLGMGGFIIYDKVINKTNEPNTEENNKEINDSTNINKEDVIGKYTYIKKCEAVSGPANEVEYYNTESYLMLNENGTFEIHDATYCQTTTNYKGKYSINEDKITLTTFEDNGSDGNGLSIFNVEEVDKNTKVVILYQNKSIKFNNIVFTK